MKNPFEPLRSRVVHGEIESKKDSEENVDKVEIEIPLGTDDANINRLVELSHEHELDRPFHYNANENGFDLFFNGVKIGFIATEDLPKELQPSLSHVDPSEIKGMIEIAARLFVRDLNNRTSKE